jgi:hypothetical protein
LKNFSKKLEKLNNFNECILCSKLLYNAQCCFIKTDPEIVNYLKLNYNYNGIKKQIEENIEIKSCTTCVKFIKKKNYYTLIATIVSYQKK